MVFQKNNNWLDTDKEKNKDMKTLGATELSLLRGLIKDLLNTCEYDDTGVTADLYDKALAAAEVLNIVWTPLVDEDDPDFEEDDYEDRFKDE